MQLWFALFNFPAVTFDLKTTRWRQTNPDARTFVNEAYKDAESHIAGSYTGSHIAGSYDLSNLYASFLYCNLL